ncbi:glyoxalase/bleomycin resistance protein/dioxygenase superfamily protein [Paenisporosarcina sp. OV554]|nr:glyoxalase/bleomycin resistance protein/dioxygenase superfamily protein [Paenisporosarcina sp. OV554]
MVAKKKLNNQSDFQLTNNIAIGVTNYENALKFYETILGMKNVQTMENETKFSISSTTFFIENNSANQVFFEFAVEDFKSAKKLLVENGCVITKEYKDTSVIIADPYGLRFHLFEVKKN